MNHDHLAERAISSINENLAGINIAAECLTQEIRKAKNTNNETAYKELWNKREALFAMAVELQRRKTAQLRSLHLAGKAIGNEAAEYSETMHRAL